MFVSQSELEQWVGEGALLENAPTAEAEPAFALHLTREKQRYGLVPAVRVSRVLTESDERGWQGRVFPIAELVAAGAEVSSGAVLIADAAYEGEEGFFLHPEQPRSALGVSPAPEPSSVPEPFANEVATIADEELWMRYILSGVA